MSLEFYLWSLYAIGYVLTFHLMMRELYLKLNPRLSYLSGMDVAVSAFVAIYNPIVLPFMSLVWLFKRLASIYNKRWL